MSPPPTNIDGTDITGATIDGQEVQEITIDGQTVFTAVPDVADSAVHRFILDEGSGSIATDSIGSSDATLTGPTYISGNFQGGNALSTDGADDEGAVSDGYPSWPGADLTWAVAFTINAPSQTNRSYLFHQFQDGDNFWGIETGFNSPTDSIGIERQNGGTTWALRNVISLDSTRKRVLIQFTGSALESYENTTSQGTNPSPNATPFVDFSATVDWFYNPNFSGSEFETIIDDIIWYESDLSASEIQTDFDAQPWT